MHTIVTKKCPLNSVYEQLPPTVQRRVAQRHMSAEDWIEKHASGTLRKNKRIGMSWQSHYWTERFAYEFGWNFEVLPSTRVNFGQAITAGDCSAITECGWYCERIMEMDIFGDEFEVKYIKAEGGFGKKAKPGVEREGCGIVVRKTSAPFVPRNHLVFAIIAELNKETGEWEAENPC